MRILMLAPRFPLPAWQGDRLRAWQMLQALAREHEVTLLTYLAQEQEQARLGDLREYSRVVTVPFRAWRHAMGILRGVSAHRPLQVLYYESNAMARAVSNALSGADAVHCNTFRLAGLLPQDFDKPLIVDFIDAISLGLERREGKGSRRNRRVIAVERGLVRSFETQLLRRASLALAVTAEDARSLGQGVSVVPLGVNLDAFSRPPANAPREHAVMTGNFGYSPNIDAAIWLVEEIFPIVQRRFPKAALRLVGARPAWPVRRLANSAIAVTGQVPNVADELRRAAVAVAPVRYGAGIKTKILEAMACATPVVATSMANSGIDARDGEEILLADTPETFAEAMRALLEDPARAARIGAAGRRLVERKFSLDAVADTVLSLYASLAKRA